MNYQHVLIGAVIVQSALLGSVSAAEPTPIPTVVMPVPLVFETHDFTLKLSASSQTIESLAPKGGNGFDFSPADRLNKRSKNGYSELGDIALRLRTDQDSKWTSISTAAERHPITPLPASGDVLAAADLSPTLPADLPLNIKREWRVTNGHLSLQFVITNTSTHAVQIGALSIPMVFNNIISDRSLAEANVTCSFSDPYVGQDAGYLQVTRINGQGPALVVAPVGKTPFEGYRRLDEPTWPSQTFEGMFAWMVHTKAYAENEWHNADPWNLSTEATLEPQQSRTYGVQFLLSPTIPAIEETLAAAGRPVAIGIPGYILPQNIDAKLFLQYGHKVRSLDVSPANAIAIQPSKAASTKWQAYTLRGKIWGRARLTVTYDDGLTQSIQCYVIKSEAQTVADMGHFLATKQWFVNDTDPFHRSPSPISYDRDADKQVTQDSRVWIAGLSDEAGAGPYVAMAMKELIAPNQDEIAHYAQFVDDVLWGGIQFKDGPNKYGVRKSVFYYDPKALPDFPYDKTLDWRSWTSWSKQASEDIGRGYNYPHVVAAYWAMYRIARNHPEMALKHPWQWYLEQSYQTTKFAFSRNPNGSRRVGWVELGLMEGDVFLSLLQDLQHEGWTAQAADTEALMRERAERWRHEDYPFGSEMAWDSTGQEEVYAWCKYFGYADKAAVSLSSVMGYTPTLPHWGYNGNARRYWDFLYDGKISRIERQIHHYGSGINALPLLSEYRTHPDAFYLLRVGYGGSMGPLSNIDQNGFASAAFHSYPDTLKWDSYTGDYGMNFFGYALTAATYVIDHPDFGWQSFGGNTSIKGNVITVTPLDAARSRVYLAPLGLWLTLDSGTFETVIINPQSHRVQIGLAPASTRSAAAYLRIEQPVQISGIGHYHPKERLKSDRSATVVPLGTKTTWVTLTDN